MKKRALCIGINDYPGTDMDLSGCIHDAEDWGKLFRKCGFEVAFLLDGQATGRGMRRAIAEVLGRAESGDLVAIHYSGHGTYVPDENGDEPDGVDECLCPHDILDKGPITDDELYTLYSDRKPGVRLVVFSDSCHSGSVARFAPIITPPTARGKKAPLRKARFMPPEVYLGLSALRKLGPRRAYRRSTPPGRYAGLLLSGCQDTEYSYDGWFNGRPNGVFSWVALETFKKMGASSTYRGWHAEIRKWLPSQQYPQTPNLYGTEPMKAWRIFQ